LRLNEKKVVAYIGSLSLISHPVDLLLQAFVRVREQAPRSALLVVGGGEDYELLKNQAASLGLGEHVMFTGRIAPHEVGAYYRLADVTVDPVNDDDAARGRSPLKMFESWLCGAPFVTADVGDRRFLMGDPPAGILTHPGDPASLAEAILKIYREPQLAEKLRKSGLEQVKSYDWKTLAGSLENFYQKFTRTAGAA
jgi:glycosyltransferase involved in cell wall biosynthesis